MFTVAGVTGNVGSSCASALLAEGQKVRVIVRDARKGESWKAKGCEVAVGTLNDVAFLTQALTGVEGAFLLLPPDYPKGEVYEHQKETVKQIAEAVKASKVPHVVFLSSIGAQHHNGTGPIQGLHHAERALEKTGVNVTFVRAAYFMENLKGSLPVAAGQGILPNFMADESQPFAQVATKDIGELAARALRQPSKGKKIYNLAGPAEHHTREVAEKVGRAIGKSVQVMTIPLAGAVGAMTQAGFPEFLARTFAEMYDGVSKGLLAWEEKGAELVRGKVTLDEFLKDAAASLKGAGHDKPDTTGHAHH